MPARQLGHRRRGQHLLRDREAGTPGAVHLDSLGVLLGPQAAVHAPFLVPGGGERDLRHDGEDGRSADLLQDQAGVERTLVTEVAVHELAQVAAVAQVARVLVEAIHSGDGAILDRQPVALLGQVVDPGHGSAHPLRHPHRRQEDVPVQEL